MKVDRTHASHCTCSGGDVFDPRVCQAILGTINALVIVLDPSGRIVAFNRACETLTGYTCEDVQGAGFMELLIPPEDHEGVRQVFALLSEGRLPANHENEWLTRSGGRRLLRWTNTVVPGADGKAAYVIGTGLDITDHVAAEKALREAERALEPYRGAEDGGTLESLRRLREAERHYRTVADFTSDWEYWEGPDGGMLYVSPSCERITGYPAEAFMRDPGLLASLILPDDRPAWDRHQQGSRQPGDVVEFRIRARDGQTRWIEYSCGPVTGQDGSAQGVRGSNRDITVRRAAEAEIRRLEHDFLHSSRVAVLATLVSSLAHELGQPLTAIMNNAQTGQAILKEPAADMREVAEVLADIVEDSRHAAGVVRNLRGMLKRQTAERTRLDLHDILHSVEQIVRSDLILHQVSIVVDDDKGKLPPVTGNRVELQQVMVNLILNAVQAMEETPPDNRHLHVTTRRADPRTVEVTVRDHGKGIPPDQLEAVFNLFFTTRREGAGMGLAVCRAIVNSHGGRIWATNHPDGGASFSFALPACAAEPSGGLERA
jgi:two-component system sensor kinase FixL